MKIARWGNSLAVRLPQVLVDKLGVREGDEIDLVPAGERRLDVVHDRRKEHMIARMDALSAPLPPDYKFDRDDANGR
jgi:antitoxin MazE